MQHYLNSQPLSELIPENRNALLQKYRPHASSKMSVLSTKTRGSTATYTRPRTPGIQSYKKDAMRIVVHRIQSYIQDVFQQIARHSAHSHIEKQRYQVSQLNARELIPSEIKPVQ